ncbi:hypothetical protein BH11PSE11_BH11PSE11_01940 [soil metagenome]
MTKVLILGANGQVARAAIDLFLDRTDTQLALYLRNARRLKEFAGNERVRIVEGDVLDPAGLEAAIAGQDLVYANLGTPRSARRAKTNLRQHSRAAGLLP